MDLSKYTELTGETVKPSQEAKVNATIRRTKAQLETLLGYTLKPKNLYTEKGKTQYEGVTPNPEDLENLQPADTEEGVYKIFPYTEADRYLHTDPFVNVYHVKLVIPVNDGEFVTVVDLESVVQQVGRDGIGKYIERHHSWFTWAWYRQYMVQETDNPFMLAVDADWIDCYPSDLMYLWADMVQYYANPNYSVLGSLKSESVDGHSWSRGNAGGGTGGDSAPETLPSNKLLLARYAGPHGSIVRNPVR